MTTKYGIIGCGMMGGEHIQNINLLDDTDVVAIVEPDAEMAARAASLAPNAQFYSTIDELMAQDLDCLLIASPNHLHVEHLQAIARNKALPTLVEKPLFTAENDHKAIADLKANFAAPIWVAMEYRYMPPITLLREQVNEVTGGIQMLTIREHRFPFLHKVGDWNRFNRYSGGTFVEKCCHFFDLMRLLMDAEPVRIMGAGGIAANHLDERYAGEAPDIFDHGYVIVEFEGQRRAMLELCMFAEGSKYQEEISAVGANGKIECLVPGPTRFWPEHLGESPEPQVIVSPRHPKGPQVIPTPVDPTLLAAGDHNGSTFYQHKGFLELVRGQRSTPDVSLDDGLKAVQMGQAAQRSMIEHRAVAFSELAR
ncbi:MAG: Gfo/Idh/MocA family oxidoreductase [Gammaproteobacteria bacterium]|nr:Gfo/Idh/MocA family oxidoreductase [Gammaproteobacteria bacterium]